MDFPSDFIRIYRNRWVIQPSSLRPGLTLEIEWTELLPADIGSKHQRNYLVKSSKGLLHAWINSARRGRLSGGTLQNIYSKLKRLTRWMVERDLWRFSELTDEAITSFLLDYKSKVGSCRKHIQVCVAIP
jgi:hypothetical protein